MKVWKLDWLEITVRCLSPGSRMRGLQSSLGQWLGLNRAPQYTRSASLLVKRLHAVVWATAKSGAHRLNSVYWMTASGCS